MATWERKDLGLSYEAAAHGIQSAIQYQMTLDEQGRVPSITSPKHLRTGIDLQKAEMGGLAMLLIDKGLFTIEEYTEYMRLAVNSELAMHEDELGFTFR